MIGLLEAYDKLCQEVYLKHNSNGIEYILNITKKLCLTKYHKSIFHNLGYQSLINSITKRNINSNVTKSINNIENESILKELWNYRDNKARILDESNDYILSNSILIKLSLLSINAITIQEIEKIIGNNKYSNEIYELFTKITNEILNENSNIEVSKSVSLKSNNVINNTTNKDYKLVANNSILSFQPQLNTNTSELFNYSTEIVSPPLVFDEVSLVHSFYIFPSFLHQFIYLIYIL